ELDEVVRIRRAGVAAAAVDLGDDGAGAGAGRRRSEYGDESGQDDEDDRDSAHGRLLTGRWCVSVCGSHRRPKAKVSVCVLAQNWHGFATLRSVQMAPRTLAAALTPLRDGGTELDEDAVAPYVTFLAANGVDGVLALGTTGEGILLTV